MASLNKVMILGRLGKDPELKYTPQQQPVCKFSMATSEKFKDKETTEWHNVVAWGKTAELCSQYLKKGSQAFIEGRIQTRSWEKDGKKHYATEIIAQSVQFLSSKESSSPVGHVAEFPPAHGVGGSDAFADIPF